jgi:hypothetical protein
MKVMRQLGDDNPGNGIALDLRCLLMENQPNGNDARPWMAFPSEAFHFLLHILKKPNCFSRFRSPAPWLSRTTT